MEDIGVEERLSFTNFLSMHIEGFEAALYISDASHSLSSALGSTPSEPRYGTPTVAPAILC